MKLSNTSFLLRFNPTLRIAALVLTFLPFSYLHSQMTDNWEWVNPRPQGNTLHTMDFVNENTGFTAGRFSTILKTTNSGVSWLKVNHDIQPDYIVTPDLLSMDFVNASIGYVGGYNQLLLKTTNGGLNWQTLALPNEEQFDSLFSVMDIKFMNNNVGYALGFFQLKSKIWKTTNGGETWATQTTGGANYLNSLYFVDENYGYAAGGALGGEVIRTTNGGATWQMVYEPKYAVYSIKFITPLKGFVGCETGRIYKTTDGGNSWTFAFSNTSLDITSLGFINETTGFGFGTGSVCTRTTDGGENWTEYPMGMPSGSQYFDSYVSPGGIINTAGAYGSMARSTDGGNTFIAPPTATKGYISNIKFVNDNTGYAVAGFSSGDILKTTDAGNTWVSQITEYTTPIYGISFRNAETGYLAGSISLYKTINGGTNWSKVYNSTSNEIFTDIFFTSDNTGYAVGTYGVMKKTTNAGLSWVSSTVPIAGTGLNSVFFVNDNTGYVAGEDNSASKTTNGGMTWQSMEDIAQTSDMSLNCVFFENENTGYIASDGAVHKTTNAGANWVLSNSPHGAYNKVQFRGNFGYAIGSEGRIIKTTNGGTNWMIQPMVTTNQLFGLYFNSDNYVYLGGILGTMLKTIPTELMPTSISNISSGVAKDFSLGQNYPNPFNPLTNIKFSIAKQGFVSLKIYNLQGREVAELVNRNINSGEYSVSWDAAHFTSGVYFYKLEQNGLSETKKMMLIK